MSKVQIAAWSRSGRIVAALAIAMISAVVYACASGGKGKDLPTVNIEVQNNLLTPTDITVFIRSGGIRQQLGFVPSGQTKTFTYTPSGSGNTYRLEAQRQLAFTVRSQPFSIVSDMTGTITWFLSSNLIGFRDKDVVETTFVQDSTKK